jgi:hypothetical protein
VAGISLCQELHEFFNDNYTEYDNSCPDDIIQVLQVRGLDISVFDKVRNNEYPDKREDKKDLKVEPLEEQHEENYNNQPDDECNWSDMFFIHAQFLLQRIVRNNYFLHSTEYMSIGMKALEDFLNAMMKVPSFLTWLCQIDPDSGMP